MGSTNLSQNIDVFDRTHPTHASATTMIIESPIILIVICLLYSGFEGIPLKVFLLLLQVLPVNSLYVSL